MRKFAACAAIALGAIGFAAGTQPAMAVVEYQKVCSLYGAGWAYIPGTATCVNLDTGETRTATDSGVVVDETQLAKDIKAAKEGVALGIAMQNAVIDPGKTFGAAVNIGVYDGSAAIAVSAAMKAVDGLTINASAGYGMGEGNFAGRAGLSYAW